MVGVRLTKRIFGMEMYRILVNFKLSYLNFAAILKEINQNYFLFSFRSLLDILLALKVWDLKFRIQSLGF